MTIECVGINIVGRVYHAGLLR